MFLLCEELPCDAMTLACCGICFITPLVTSLAEEAAALPYTMGEHRANLNEGGASNSLAVFVAKRFAYALLDGVLTCGCIIVVANFALKVYFLGGELLSH